MKGTTVDRLVPGGARVPGGKAKADCALAFPRFNFSVGWILLFCFDPFPLDKNLSDGSFDSHRAQNYRNGKVAVIDLRRSAGEHKFRDQTGVIGYIK